MPSYPAPINAPEPIQDTTGFTPQVVSGDGFQASSNSEQSMSFNKKASFSGKKAKLWAGLGVVVLLLATSVGAGTWLMGADKSTEDRSKASNIGITSTTLTLGTSLTPTTVADAAEYGVFLKTDPTTTVVKTVRFDVALPMPMVVSDLSEQSNEGSFLLGMLAPQAQAQTVYGDPPPATSPKPTLTPAPSAPSSRVPSTGYACTMEYSPVCGADGKTYGNACEAGRAGQTKYTNGACPTPKPTPSPTPIPPHGDPPPATPPPFTPPPVSVTRTLLSQDGVIVSTMLTERDLSVMQVEVQDSAKGPLLKVVANVSAEYAKTLGLSKEMFKISIVSNGQTAQTPPVFRYQSVLGSLTSDPGTTRELLATTPTITPPPVTPPPATLKPATPPPIYVTPKPSITPYPTVRPTVTPAPTFRPTPTPIGATPRPATPPPYTPRPTGYPTPSPIVPTVKTIQIDGVPSSPVPSVRPTVVPTVRPTPRPTATPRPWWQRLFGF